MTRAKPVRQVISVTLMGLVLHSCYGWSARPDIGTPAIVAEQPQRIRVEGSGDATKIVVHNPEIVGDSLTGFVGHWRHRTRIALHLDEVRSVETRKLSAARTVTLIVVGVPLTAVTALFVACILTPNSPNPPPGDFTC